MNTTLVINRKGGAGKTTVATNLASYFASTHIATTIMDYDPQGSSLNWLKLRPPHLGKIHGSNAAPERFGTLRGVAMYVPPDTRQLIIDAPAGATGVPLQQMLRRANSILIPVTPSTIDVHATDVRRLLNENKGNGEDLGDRVDVLSKRDLPKPFVGIRLVAVPRAENIDHSLGRLPHPHNFLKMLFEKEH